MMTADAQLGDLLQANGESGLWPQIQALGHPPLVFWWHNVDAWIRAIETARAHVDLDDGVPREPLALPTVVTTQSLKRAVLAFLKPSATASTLGTSCLVCSLAETVTVGYQLRTLDDHPWTHRVVALHDRETMGPLASVFMPRGRRASAFDNVTPRDKTTLVWG
ncbi:hypothetical protein PsorP6_006519 [Peronosclerospora sorghi]|uniref:Uncharacterized protein n=1 Tax=Peronosclerospora sorghi TaxID=230839 RepID=A0ACC0W1A6_9STRA|nr:hypothetical protein PsorP6_006519 [Peronosclerospora sorghi]